MKDMTEAEQFLLAFCITVMICGVYLCWKVMKGVFIEVGLDQKFLNLFRPPNRELVEDDLGNFHWCDKNEVEVEGEGERDDPK